MSKLRCRMLAASLSLALAAPASAQKLPSGPDHRIRDRAYDLRHLRAELRVMPERGRIDGRAAITLAPLGVLSRVELDAIGLDVSSVTLGGAPVEFATQGGKLRIDLPEPAGPTSSLELVVAYAAEPEAGMYFQPDRRDPRRHWVTTYGEGGLHANWVPLYNAPNDKFTSEMVITVPEPYVVISNGRLVATTRGERQSTWHWIQERPHPDYLIALYIGDYERGELAPAFGEIPLAYWVPRGRLAEGAHAFRNTTAMVEFFSERFGYRYPWSKYDQIVAPDYPVGAMEHTGVTGHDEGVLRRPGEAPDEFGPPFFDRVSDVWSAEASISHELAHHWFGDDVTCSDLSRIWLNESFASYLMMLWDERRLGRDELLWQVERARRAYFEFVDREHVIRPLEWPRYEKYGDVYQQEITYFKGAAILHMLRAAVGDEAYFDSLRHYLETHAAGNVVSEDLAAAFRDAAGANLDWFFADWIHGGGAPRLEVSYVYRPDRKVVDLEVLQVQPLVEGQGLFRLPVRVRIDTAGESRSETVWVEKDEEHFLFAAEEEPVMVSLDGEGDLVARIDFAKPARELLHQARHDALPGRMRALEQLVARHPASDETQLALKAAQGAESFWAERAEAARLLGAVRTPAARALAERALSEADYRVRKGAVLGLAGFGPAAKARLREVVERDPHADVVGTAIVALARIDPQLERGFLERQLARGAWYDEIRLATVLAMKELARGDLLPLVRGSAAPSFNQAVRQAALEAWEVIAPTDPELHAALLDAADGPIYKLQIFALAALGRRGVESAAPLLETTVERNFDENMAVLAREALAEIRRLGSAPDR